MSDVCPVCGEENGRLGQHWASGRCTYPKLSDHQRDVVTGVLMSDGYINRRDGRNPRLKVDSINKKYLHLLDEIFDAFSTGEPTCYRTADEAASRDTLSRFDNSSYQDQYTWGSRSLPELEKWAGWYDSGKKIWPEDITLTPTVLKHLYAGDGSLHKKNRTITIYLSNEMENRDKVNDYFTEQGLPEPIWQEESRDDGSISARIRWNKNESKELLEYMGQPVMGHEYKW